MPFKIGDFGHVTEHNLLANQILSKANSADVPGIADGVVQDTVPALVTSLADPASGSTFSTALSNTIVTSGAPTGITTTKRFDPDTQAYNLTASSFRRWRGALAGALAGTGLAKVHLYGDSTTEGFLGTPTAYTGGYPAQLRRRVATRTKNTGTGICYVMGFTNGDTRFAFTGTWVYSNNGPYGTGGSQQASRYSSTAGSTMTFTPDVACDSFTIHYIANSSSGIFSASVDGGAAVTQNAYSASNAISTKVVSAGASGMHSITITVPSDGKVFFFFAVEATNGTTGVRVTTCARGGMRASELATVTYAPVSSLNMAVNVPAPDLGIIGFGINEYNGTGVTVAQYTTALQTLIDTIKLTGDVLLVAALPISDQTRTPSQNAYRQALYALADSNNVPVLDLAHRWESYAISNAAPLALYGDIVHPNTKGYGDMASAVFDVIMRGA